MVRNILVTVLLSFGMAFPVLGQEAPSPEVRVLPWNGHPAAFSLTFDDGDASHLDVAVPELDKRGLKATFFLIANKIDREDEWRKLPAKGHEIANHTLEHKHVSELDKEGEKSQVSGARNVLQKKFGIQVSTFAYPFCEITPGLREWVQKTHLLGRGGGGSDPVLLPQSEPDWMNLPSRTTLTALPMSTYEQWIADGTQRGGWTTLMIHGLEGTVYGWEPITRETFAGLLDRLQKSGAWIGTFLEVGAYFRAQKEFESSKVTRQGSAAYWTWKVPEGTPQGTKLKVSVGKEAGKKVELRQGDKVLSPDESGSYDILFSKGNLRVQFLPDEKASKP